MAADGMLKVEDVASRLNVREEAVRRWLRQGQLKGIRLGGTRLGWRIPEAELERFIADLTEQSVPGGHGEPAPYRANGTTATTQTGTRGKS
ncbi:MAG TPA: helix-turn-helix domain-containing protein [Chloroflexota bacterium]|jgi:excisionase family DNA binding protein